MAFSFNFHQSVPVMRVDVIPNVYNACSQSSFETENDMIRPMTTDGVKRSKVDFKWMRLLGGAPEMKELVVVEKPNMKVIKVLKDMSSDLIYGDFEADVSKNILQTLDSMYDSLLNGGAQRNAIYEQKDFSAVVSSIVSDEFSYAGSTKIGRSYTSSQQQRLKTKILNTMYKTTHLELDIVSSYATMLFNAFGDDSMEALKELVSSPGLIYDGFKKEYSIDRKSVKVMVCALIGALPKKPVMYGLDHDEMGAVHTFSEHPFVSDLHSNLLLVSKKMQEMYPGFWTVMKKHAELEGKSDHDEGVALCMFAGDMENAVMRVVIKEISGNNPQDIVWKFDGVLMNRDFILGEQTEFCDELSEKVRSKLNIYVKFAVKALADNSYPICLPTEELRDDTSPYGMFKKEFEKKFFRVEDPPVYCQLMGQGRVLDLNDCQFKHNTMEQPAEFVKQWKADPFKRKYVMKDFAPPPCILRPNAFNTWSGFGFEDMEDVVIPSDFSLDMYKIHVRYLMGSNDECTAYFNKLIAYKIQNPGNTWRVMPFIRSTPGVGKDVFFTFVEKLFGRVNCLRVGKIGEVMEKASHLLDSKLMVCFSEAEFQDNARFNDALKNIITAETVMVKKKYVNEYEIRSCACFMAFSNNFTAFQIAPDDRRFFAVTADGTYANDPAYHIPLIEYLNKPETIKAVGEWYKNMDIGDFDPSGERPITKTHQEMASSSISLMDITLRKMWPIWKAQCGDNDPAYRILEDQSGGSYLRIPVRTIWDDFQIVAAGMNVLNSDSRSKMVQYGTRLLSEMNARMKRYKAISSMEDVIVSYRSHGKRFQKIDIRAVDRYLTEMIGEDEADGDDGEEDGMAPGFNRGN